MPGIRKQGAVLGAGLQGVLLFLGSIEDVAEVFEGCAEVVPFLACRTVRDQVFELAEDVHSPAREALGFAVVTLAGAELGQVLDVRADGAGDELGLFAQEWDGLRSTWD